MGGAEDRRRQVTADVRLLGALAGPLAQVLPRHLIDDLRAPDRPADPYPVRVVVATLAHGLDPVAPVDRLTGWAGRPVRPGSCPVRLVPVSAGPATVTLTPQQHHWATNQAHTVAAALAGLRPRSGPAWSPPPDRPDLDATVRWLTTRPLVPVAGRADGPHVAGLIGRLDDLVELAGLVRVVVGGAPTPRTPLTVRTPLTGVPVDAAADGPPLTVLDVSATIPGPGRSFVDVGALLRDAHVAVIAVELPVLDSPDAGRVGALLHQALAELPPSQVTVLVSTDPLPQGPDRPWIGPYAASRLGVDATWATTGVHQVGTAMGPATKRELDATIGLERENARFLEALESALRA